MRTFVLATLYCVWPAGVILARILARLRIRFQLINGASWLVALVIGTAGSPADKALPAGLIAGAIGCLFTWYATTAGITFEFAPKKVYEVEEGKVPRAEFVVGALVALIGVTAAVLAIAG